VNLLFTEPFKRDYGELSAKIQQALDKALKLLVSNCGTHHSKLENCPERKFGTPELHTITVLLFSTLVI